MVAMRYKISKSVANRLLRLLHDITLYEAKQLLDGLAYEYMLDEMVVIDYQERIPHCKTTFASHYAVIWDRYEFACEKRVQFGGGPPGSYGWFTGTIVTFVCDRIMYHAAKFGTDTVTPLLKPYGFMEKRDDGCTVIRDVTEV